MYIESVPRIQDPTNTLPILSLMVTVQNLNETARSLNGCKGRGGGESQVLFHRGICRYYGFNSILKSNQKYVTLQLELSLSNDKLQKE